MEPEQRQTTKSPAAMMAQGFGDCKHYALFCAGVLDALNRRGKKIDWCYRFASYSFFAPEPEHVFIVVKDQGKEIWIDPVPGAEKVTPVWQKDKKIKIDKMPLYRISGLPYAYDTIGAKKNVFSTAWRGVKKVTLSSARGAFLALVSLNFFGYATKFSKAIWQPNGDYNLKNKDKIKKLWQDRLGGDWTQLQNAIKKGAKKKAVLGAYSVDDYAMLGGKHKKSKQKAGGGAAPATSAPSAGSSAASAAAGAASAIAASNPATAPWVVQATAIIAAIIPLLDSLLKNPKGGEPYTGGDIETGGGTYTGDGTPPPSGDKSNIKSFITNNPILIVGGLAALYFLTKKRT
jgi:hypothetical protein